MKTAPETPPVKLGELIDHMLAIRDARKDLDKQSADLKQEYDELEQMLLTRLDEEDTTQGRSKTATATVSQMLIPTIEDWEKFEEYVKDNDAFYMLQRRVAAAAFRELNAQGVVIPGIKPMIQKSISLRRL
jgi:hypothetical protein